MLRGLRTAWLIALRCTSLALVTGSVHAQSPPVPDSKSSTPYDIAAVSGNPAAAAYPTGTGWLGHVLGLRDEWGVRLGGIWLADTNVLAVGGARPGTATTNSALFIGLDMDAQKLVNWRGASLGFQYLQFNGADTNGEAGSVLGYNGIVGLPPFNRSELFMAWYAQDVIKDVLKVRIGRMDPTIDFDNVLRPVVFRDKNENIPAVSGLIKAPTNGAMAGAIPGYPNVGNGVLATLTPTHSFYVNLAVYDGNLARSIETGVNPPLFNGYYFAIGEIGIDWTLGETHHPGQFGIGLWRQTGLISVVGITEEGYGGFYLFGSQRIAHGVNPRVPSSAITTFYQVAANSSLTLPIQQYFGGGMTAFGLIGNRDRDSMGFGAFVSRLNLNLFARPTELTFQAYY